MTDKKLQREDRFLKQQELRKKMTVDQIQYLIQTGRLYKVKELLGK